MPIATFQGPGLGRVDGTAAVWQGEGFVFLFNPNAKALNASFTVDESIGVANSSAGEAYNLAALYPPVYTPPGKCQHRGTVTVTVAASDAVVLQLSKARLTDTVHVPSLTVGNRRGATVRYEQGVVAIDGLTGNKGTETELEVTLPPNTAAQVFVIRVRVRVRVRISPTPRPRSLGLGLAQPEASALTLLP